eukprot:gb/GECG01006801.1/.p1 GENE.gb/GECG01006801.1/~~gb/GECG01006801.1/.p1  ORF type:complete len:326 (+),score=48.40 gb/GECG01006801.1/:1-978(+)
MWMQRVTRRLAAASGLSINGGRHAVSRPIFCAASSLTSNQLSKQSINSMGIKCGPRSFATEATGTEFKVERLEGEHEGVVVFTMDRSKSKNALGRNMVQEMQTALDNVRFDPKVRAVILKSDVEKVFCAGADLKERATMTQQEVGQFVSALRSAFSGMENLPMPTIAAIEGAALGGGLELSLACDFRIAGGSAVLGLPETSLAIIPGAGGTQRLPRLIGSARAKELIFTARRLSADQAKDYGVVEYSVDAGSAYDKALELAKEITPNGPVALRMAKEAISRGMQTDVATGMEIEKNCYAQIIPTKDRLEGIQAFKEKRKPSYTGE